MTHTKPTIRVMNLLCPALSMHRKSKSGYFTRTLNSLRKKRKLRGPVPPSESNVIPVCSWPPGTDCPFFSIKARLKGLGYEPWQLNLDIEDPESNMWLDYLYTPKRLTEKGVDSSLSFTAPAVH